MSSWVQMLVPYAQFSRVGFVNILAFRLRYFTGIITYFLNVTVYYFIWSAVYRGGIAIAGYDLAQMITIFLCDQAGQPGSWLAVTGACGWVACWVSISVT